MTAWPGCQRIEPNVRSFHAPPSSACQGCDAPVVGARATLRVVRNPGAKNSPKQEWKNGKPQPYQDCGDGLAVSKSGHDQENHLDTDQHDRVIVQPKHDPVDQHETINSAVSPEKKAWRPPFGSAGLSGRARRIIRYTDATARSVTAEYILASWLYNTRTGEKTTSPAATRRVILSAGQPVLATCQSKEATSALARAAGSRRAASLLPKSPVQ